MTAKVPANNVRLKRAYEPPEPADGTRILVDRLWPRGVSKAAAAIDHWAKDLAPSAALRAWFSHDPARFAEFERRQIAELRSQRAAVTELRALARKGTVTLVHAAHDEAHNDAVVLRKVLLR